MNADKKQMRELQRFLAGHGIAHYLPTTVTASLDSTFRALEHMANAIEDAQFENEAVPAGIPSHMATSSRHSQNILLKFRLQSFYTILTWNRFLKKSNKVRSLATSI